MSESTEAPQPAGQPPPGSSEAPASSAPCACQSKSSPSNAFVYAIGKLEVRFPSVGVEREYAQLRRQLEGDGKELTSTSKRMAEVLTRHTYLARQLCYVLSVGGVPAYIVMPTGADVLQGLVAGVAGSSEADAYTLIIGRRGPMSSPTQCSGVLAPLVACDTSYSFTTSEWADSLSATLKGPLKQRKVDQASFRGFCREQFTHFTGVENLGATDAHRALNYMLMRHSGLVLAALERPGKSLDQVESRVLADVDVRRVVLVIFTFLDRETGVPERLACRVDVTDEFPFVVGHEPSLPAPIGLVPYVDHRDSAVF